MRSPKKKCICKKCEDCNFFWNWDVENEEGLRKIIKRCGFEILFEEIPRIRGSIDGAQQASNEARNRIQCLGEAMVQTGILGMPEDKKLLEK